MPRQPTSAKYRAPCVAKPRIVLALLPLALLLFTLPATGGSAAEPKPHVDLYGDPLPPGAIARLGTIRFRRGAVVTSSALSSDGRRLVAGYGSGDVVIWDAKTGKVVRELPLAHRAAVSAVSFSPDGSLVISAGEDLYIQLWNVATGKLVHFARRPYNLENSEYVSPPGFDWVALSADNAHLAAGTTDGHLMLYDVPRDIQPYCLADDRIGSNATLVRGKFSPDGKLLFDVTTPTNVIRALDTGTGRIKRSYSGHVGGITDLAVSPNGKLLASVGADRTLRLWKVATQTELWKIVDPHPNEEFTAAFTRTAQSCSRGHKEAAGANGMSRRSTRKRPCLGRIGARGPSPRRTTERSRTNCPVGMQSPFTRSSRTMTIQHLSGTRPATSRWRFLPTTASSHRVVTTRCDSGIFAQRQLWEIDGFFEPAGFSKDGRRLAVFESNKGYRIVDVATGRFDKSSPTFKGYVTSAAGRPLGVFSGAMLTLFEPENGHDVGTFNMSYAGEISTATAISSDKKELLVAGHATGVERSRCELRRRDPQIELPESI